MTEFNFDTVFDETMQTHNLDTVVILGHLNPDGDAAGSVMSLAHYIHVNYPQYRVFPYLAKTLERGPKKMVVEDKTFVPFEMPDISGKQYCVIVCDNATLERMIGLEYYQNAAANMMSCLAPKIKNVTIDDLNWERTIDIEEVVTHNESDWSLPDDARLQYTKSEIQSYKDVLDHYETVTETKTRSVIDHYEEKSSYVDLGNGYFEEQTESVPVYTEETYTEDAEKPVYRKEPVYATKYYYEIDKWTVVDTAKSSGNDQNPSWPESKLKDGQRTGAEEEHYFVTATYEKKKGKTETGRYEMDFSQWKELKKGEKIELKIDAAGFAEINQK